MNTVNVIITVTLLVLAVILNQAFKDKESDKRQTSYGKAFAVHILTNK